MARPLRLSIAGRRWAVKYRKRLAGGCLGLCDYDNHTLTIRSDMAPIEEADTLIHEAMHALIASAGIVFPDDTAEEQVVRSISSGLVGLLADNPKLLDHINTLIKENA